MTPQAAVTWQASRLTGNDALAVRVSKKLKTDELLVGSLASTILRKHLDDVPLWRGDNVAIKQLIDDFARYLYLPRIAGPEVLMQAVRSGLGLLTWKTKTFAYAEGYDGAAAIEIVASLPNGASDQLVRTVTENCRTLRFDSQGFEKE